MEIEFTEATAEQIPALVALVNSAYRGDSSRKGWTTEADLLDGQRIDAEMMESLLKKEDSTILVATEVDNDEVLGCVHLEKQNETCHLGLLTVRPDLQRKSIGKQMLEESEAFAQFWDCTEISMKVLSVRSELIQWYKKKGFRQTTETHPFPKEDPRFGIPKTELEFCVLRKKVSL